MPEDPEDRTHWRNFVIASIVIAAGSAIAGEVAKAIGDALRQRWGVDPDEPEKDEKDKQADEKK
jgi:hypothetical protein